MAAILPPGGGDRWDILGPIFEELYGSSPNKPTHITTGLVDEVESIVLPPDLAKLFITDLSVAKDSVNSSMSFDKQMAHERIFPPGKNTSKEEIGFWAQSLKRRYELDYGQLTAETWNEFNASLKEIIEKGLGIRLPELRFNPAEDFKALGAKYKEWSSAHKSNIEASSIRGFINKLSAVRERVFELGDKFKLKFVEGYSRGFKSLGLVPLAEELERVFSTPFIFHKESDIVDQTFFSYPELDEAMIAAGMDTLEAKNMCLALVEAFNEQSMVEEGFDFEDLSLNYLQNIFNFIDDSALNVIIFKQTALAFEDARDLMDEAFSYRSTAQKSVRNNLKVLFGKIKDKYSQTFFSPVELKNLENEDYMSMRDIINRIIRSLDTMVV